MTPRRVAAGALAALLVACAATGARDASAQDAGVTTNEAAKHFRRGVDLYSESDYAGALVEFKRAYILAPSSAALYNIGETQFQLQHYADALQSFRRFLTEFGPDEAHRAEVEANVQVLRARVGHLRVTTIPSGAEISIDDQTMGKTPMPEPLLVSVGHRKLVATMLGRPPITRYIDVATDDDLSVTLQLPPPAVVAAPAAQTSRPRGAGPAPPESHAGLLVAGWVTTGVLAAGAASFGLLAIHEEDLLKAARNAFPGSASTMSHDASLVGTYSAVADSLTLGALIVGGLSLYRTLSSSGAEPRQDSAAPTLHASLGPGSAGLTMTF